MDQVFLPGTIRDRIKDLMKSTKMTQAELAVRIGTAESTLSRFLRGDTDKLGNENIIRIARVFNVSTDFLLGEVNVPDRVNYDISELGLSVQAARNLYTHKVNPQVVNALLENPEFANTTNLISRYLDDELAKGFAAQNQLYATVAGMLGSTPGVVEEVKNLQVPVYQFDLTAIQRSFMSAVQAVKKEVGNDLSASRELTSQAVKKIYAELTKGQKNTDLIAVRLRLQSVEKFRKPGAFNYISEGDKGELLQQIAPIVHLDDTDEYAKRFDNFVYGLMIAAMEQMPSFKYAQKQLRDIGTLLERKVSIPQVKAKLTIIKEVNTDAFWETNDILLFEKVRKELRELIKFLNEGGNPKNPIITHLTDPIIDQQEGIQLDPAYDFEDYRAKVNRYVNEHSDTMAIHKLTHNIPLSIGDYQELERVLTSELGSREDYVREFGDTPFGLLVRKIAKLDHDAAMQAFSAFINDQSLNQKQIAFVHKIINHIEQNGYMESVTELQKPPFDKPIGFVKLFDAKTRAALMATINQIRENAVMIAA